MSAAQASSKNLPAFQWKSSREWVFMCIDAGFWYLLSLGWDMKADSATQKSSEMEVDAEVCGGYNTLV